MAPINKEQGIATVREMSNALIFSQSVQHPRSLAFICHWNLDAFNRNVRHSRASCFLKNGWHFHPGPLADCSSLSYKYVHRKSPGCTVTLGSNLAIPSEVEGVHTLCMIQQFYFYISTLEKCPRVPKDVHCNTIFNREKLKIISLPISKEWISSEWISGGL